MLTDTEVFLISRGKEKKGSWNDFNVLIKTT